MEAVHKLQFPEQSVDLARQQFDVDAVQYFDGPERFSQVFDTECRAPIDRLRLLALSQPT